MIALATTQTETVPDQGVASSLGLNGTLFIFQLINFAIVATIIWFLILKPLTSKLAERAKIIDDSLENAKKVEENLRRSETKFQERIDDAKVEANKIVERATASATEVVTGMKTKAQSEIEDLVAKAKSCISDERVRTLNEIKTQTVEVIVLALEKILKEKVTDEKDMGIIQDLVKKLR